MTTKPKRPYQSVNIMPDDHERLKCLAARFTDADTTRTRPVSLPETVRRLLDYYEVNEGITI